ncbi:MAG: hypothetical protein EZS28_049013, partial [Streblomastix strix]
MQQEEQPVKEVGKDEPEGDLNKEQQPQNPSQTENVQIEKQDQQNVQDDKLNKDDDDEEEEGDIQFKGIDGRTFYVENKLWAFDEQGNPCSKEEFDKFQKEADPELLKSLRADDLSSTQQSGSVHTLPAEQYKFVPVSPIINQPIKNEKSLFSGMAAMHNQDVELAKSKQ